MFLINVQSDNIVVIDPEGDTVTIPARVRKWCRQLHTPVFQHGQLVDGTVLNPVELVIDILAPPQDALQALTGTQIKVQEGLHTRMMEVSYRAEAAQLVLIEVPQSPICM